MAKTQTYGDLITVLSKKISRTTEDEYAALLCNMTIAEIWKRYDWREAIEVLPPFWLAPRTQDYGAPMSIVPTDFEGFRTAQLIQLSGTPVQITPLETTKFLEKTSAQSFPQSICYNPELNCYRLWPMVPDSWGSPEYLVTGTYKILPPRVTSSTFQGTVLPFDDKYFYPIMETGLWKGYELNGSPAEEKAMLKALTAIDEMARDQGLNDGDSQITPSGPLAITSNSFYPGLF